MLKRLKISSRVNVLIVGPLIAIAGLIVGSYLAINQASLTGTQTQRLISAQDLRADILPPPASLQNSVSALYGMVVDAREGFTADSMSADAPVQQLLQAERDYNTRIQYWIDDDNPELTSALTVDAASVANRFWSGVHSQLLPAYERKDLPAVEEAAETLFRIYEEERVSLLEQVELADAEVAESTSDAKQFVSFVAATMLVIGLVLAIGTLILALRVRRSIVRPIASLTAKAHSVAAEELPEAVLHIQNMSQGDAPVEIEPFKVDTSDELAELATSFNSMQDAAVQLATEQADARKAVAANLINIARRNQGLLERTLGFITTLEQNERDPETLERLFRLDHLTTRMRRQAQSLLVLAGYETKRLWSKPMAFGDVVRLAQAQIEDYAKIEINDVGQSMVLGADAPQLAHLLAELMENASNFSPPNKRVMIVGRRTSRGHQLAIVDYGVGMTEDELAVANARIKDASSFERTASATLGLHVVGRIAARYGITARLVETAGGIGVTAIVEIPSSLLADDSAEQRPEADHLTVPAPSPQEIYGDSQSTSAAATAPAHETVSAQQVREIVGESTGSFEPEPAIQAPIAPAFGAPNHGSMRMPTTSERPPMFDGSSAAPAPPAMPAATADGAAAADERTRSGMTKRVAGAQLPNLGAARLDHSGSKATADQVRSRLSSLQSGVVRGRQDLNNDSNGAQ